MGHLCGGEKRKIDDKGRRKDDSVKLRRRGKRIKKMVMEEKIRK